MDFLIRAQHAPNIKSERPFGKPKTSPSQAKKSAPSASSAVQNPSAKSPLHHTRYTLITVLLNSSQKSPESLLELRKHLREQFPDAHRAPSGKPAPPRDTLKTGAPCLDQAGIPRGTLTEVIGPPGAPHTGGALLISSILTAAATDQRRIILIDGRDSFDPASNGAELCQQLLWVRCRKATEAIRCADLLLRDGNLPLILMDLQLNPARELQQIPGTTWFRLRNLAEQTAAALILLTPTQIVTSAHQRFHLISPQSLTYSQDSWRHDLQMGQELKASRQRQPLRQSA